MNAHKNILTSFLTFLLILGGTQTSLAAEEKASHSNETTEAAQEAQTVEWIVKESPYSVEETADKLVTAIEKAGATVFARINHAENAKKADLTLDPTTLILFGNPKIGTPLMLENRRVALDLPVRVLIWSENGTTKLGALSPESLKERYTLEKTDAPLAKMNKALNGLMGGAIQQ